MNCNTCEKRLDCELYKYDLARKRWAEMPIARPRSDADIVRDAAFGESGERCAGQGAIRHAPIQGGASGL